MIVGIDFDGTTVKHVFPEIGETVPHALRVMRRLLANGHQIILWTMRSDSGDYEDVLKNAVEYFKENSIELFGVNLNPGQDWSNSPKAYCHIYIDDAGLGCPLIDPSSPIVDYGVGEKPRPYVDWLKVEKLLAEQGYFEVI